MGIRGMENDILLYDCSCGFERRIDLTGEEGPSFYISEYQKGFVRLPACPECGVKSFIFAGNDDVEGAHYRRVLVQRIVSRFDRVEDGTDKADAVKYVNNLEKYYTNKGDVSGKNEFNGKTEINRKMEKRNPRSQTMSNFKEVFDNLKDQAKYRTAQKEEKVKLQEKTDAMVMAALESTIPTSTGTTD